MKKKILFMAIAAALTLSACSGKSTTTDQKGNSDAVSTASTAETTTSTIISSIADSNSSSETTSDTNTEEPSDEAGYKQAYKEIIESEREKKASLTEEKTYFVPPFYESICSSTHKLLFPCTPCTLILKNQQSHKNTNCMLWF